MINIANKDIVDDLFSKATNTNTCFPKSSIKNIRKGVALRLRRIWDSDNKFERRMKEYQNYFIAREYKPRKVRKQFSDIRNISREDFLILLQMIYFSIFREKYV